MSKENVLLNPSYRVNDVISNPLVFFLDVEDFNLCNQYAPISLKYSPQSNKEPFFKKNSPPTKSIISISENIRQIYKSIETDSSNRKITTNIIFSPCFQCFTTLPFHGALLKELKMMTKTVDKSSRKCRSFVWQQLFVLVGVEKEADDYFSDVLKSILDQEKMNLIEIEIMYLSFILCLRLLPSLLDPNHKDDPLLNKKRDELKELLLENATEFFKTLQKDMPIIRVPFTQIVSSQHSKNISPIKILQQNTSHLNLAQQLKQLQIWAPQLDDLKDDSINSIKENIEDFKDNENMTFVSLFNKWEKDITTYKNKIEKMYNDIIMLNLKLSKYMQPKFSNSQIEDMMKTAPSPIWPYNPNHVFTLPTSPIPIPPALSPLPTPFRSIPIYPQHSNVIKPTARPVTAVNTINTSFTPKSKDGSNSPRIIFSENSSFEKKTPLASTPKKRSKDSDDDDESLQTKRKKDDSDDQVEVDSK